MLALDLEILTGAYRASSRDGLSSEWPPHPERIFSALVQAWADTGRGAEKAALEWLERIEPPEIEAANAFERPVPTVFVPPNDLRGDELAALPERRRRQGRTFRAALPRDALVRFRWKEDPPADVAGALSALAAQVASVGHSASLVRLEFHREVGPASDPARVLSPDPNGPEVLRMPYAGRLADLVHWFDTKNGTKAAERPRTLRTERFSWGARHDAAVKSVFGGPDDWYVFEDTGGDRPDVLAFAHVARRVRDVLMRVGFQPAPEIVSGHRADGAPSIRPHCAVVPLLNVGWPHATGEVLGFALVLPREHSDDERRAVVSAVGGFVEKDGDIEGPVRLQLTERLAWMVERAPHPTRASLKSGRWCARSRSWGSVTPVLLDRFPEHGDVREEARIIAAACGHIGLPEPESIEIHKHSAVSAAPTTYPARGREGKLPDWVFPSGSSLRSRPRRHVVLRFSEEIEGPVLLGAGRYHGFGMCLPIRDTERAHP